MKKVLKLTLAVVCVMFSTSLFAQKIGYVNTDEIIANMKETQDAYTQLEAYAKDLQAQAETIQVEFNNKLADFQKNQETMAASVKQIKQQELEQLQQRYAEFQNIAQQDFQKKEAELLEPVQKKAQEAVNKIAKANGYLAVFNTSIPSLVYFDEAQLTDIAPLVNKELGIVAK